MSKAIFDTIQSLSTGKQIVVDEIFDKASLSNAQVATTTGTQTLAGALDSRIAVFNSIADMLATDTGLLATGQTVAVKDCLFEWTGAEFKSLNYVTPEAYQAAGDGVADDTAAIQAWWESSYQNKKARGVYSVALPETGALNTASSAFYADLRGAEFIPQVNTKYMLRVDVPAATTVDYVIIQGGKTSAGNKLARPLEIGGDGYAKLVLATENIAQDLNENGLSFSVQGCNISLKADSVQVYNNNYQNLAKVTDAPGIVACQAISVTSVVGACHIFGNVIKNVTTDNDIDADGIAVFSDNRLASPSEIQPVDVRIYNNRLEECQGRFVKLQSPGKVYHNDFRSMTLPLITQFRAVDAQFGGVDCLGNEWRVGDITVGAAADFMFVNGKGDTGSEETAGSCRKNKLYMVPTIRYLAHFSVGGGAHRLDVEGNTIESSTPGSKVTDLVRFDLPNLAADFSEASIEVTGNNFEIGSSSVLLVTGDAFEDAAINSKISIDVKNNKTHKPLAGSLVIQALSGVVPYLGDFLIYGNGISPEITAKGVDALSLRDGNSIYFTTDGTGTGGLLNTPPAYDRFVSVDSMAGVVKLASATGSTAICSKANNDWYEYTGTAL